MVTAVCVSGAVQEAVMMQAQEDEEEEVKKELQAIGQSQAPSAHSYDFESSIQK